MCYLSLLVVLFVAVMNVMLWLCVVLRCLLFGVCCLLLVVCYRLFVVNFSLFVD